VKPLHQRFIELIRSGPNGLFSRGDLERLDAHVADGIAGAGVISQLPCSSIVDIGSGGGVPGIPLAIELEDAELCLVESQGWKAEFLLSCARALDLESRLRVCAERAEAAPGVLGREGFDVGTARALAAPIVVAEYLSPLVRVGGHLVLWSTSEQARDPLVAARAELGLGAPTIEPLPTPLRADGVLVVWPKVAACDERFPRRVGVAAKRPLR
jgi:16S rRNA (guanine527-N7)-methyltransferase